MKQTGKATIRAAKMQYSAAQRKLYNITIWQLADGSYEAFPAGHPVPADAVKVEPEFDNEAEAADQEHQ